MLRFATAVVHAWTWLYTSGLDPDLRDDRRGQIESDIWEFKDDGQEQGIGEWWLAGHMLIRLVLGMSDDLLWRSEQATVRATVVALGLGDSTTSPVTLRRVSWFGVSATVHALLVLLSVWLAPQLTSAALHGTVAVGPTIVFVPSTDVVLSGSIGNPVAAAEFAPDDDLGLQLGGDSTLSLPGFTFDFSKVIVRAGTLFPFVTGTVSLERIAAAAMLPKPGKRLVNPFGRSAAGAAGPPALDLPPAELQKLIDKTWARRDRWSAFAPILPLAENFSANAGALPTVFHAYVEQNGLQPYVEADLRDPRLWTQLGVVADHADFIDFISRYLARHRSAKASTELLFLLDTLVQGSYDTLTALLDVIPEEDLKWTRMANPAAFDAIVKIQQHYRAALERRGISSRAALRLYFDEARINILTNLLETTPSGYRANDAHFLIGAIYWRDGRTAEAEAAWSSLAAISQADRYGAASTAIIDALQHRDAPSVDALRIRRILDGERGRWISFSHDRLEQFGYRFNVF